MVRLGKRRLPEPGRAGLQARVREHDLVLLPPLRVMNLSGGSGFLFVPRDAGLNGPLYPDMATLEVLERWNHDG
jgi:hypothetical protein